MNQRSRVGECGVSKNKQTERAFLRKEGEETVSEAINSSFKKINKNHLSGSLLIFFKKQNQKTPLNTNVAGSVEVGESERTQQLHALARRKNPIIKNTPLKRDLQIVHKSVLA